MDRYNDISYSRQISVVIQYMFERDKKNDFQKRDIARRPRIFHPGLFEQE